MTGSHSSLAIRFGEGLAKHGERRRVVVAVSGGLDSCVLLHLARFACRALEHDLTVAHFDHRMRSSSADDARWVAGLCRVWNVPLHIGRAATELTSEEGARDARYAFLADVSARADASLVLTGHHADDQAETVLFRLLRGSGSRGLSGIPAHRPPGIVRPLLDFWRSELLEYAEGAHISWREDPTNRTATYARNAIRSRILPDAERLVAPGARKALVRLADVAGEEEAAWESVLPGLMRPLDVRDIDGGYSFERAGLLSLHRAVQARAIRALAAKLEAPLDHAATALAVDFVASGSSGRAIQLGGSVSLGVELERCVLGRVTLAGDTLAGDDQVLSIEDPGPGHGSVTLAGSPIPVAWGGDEPGRLRRSERFALRGLHFPLVVRSRRPGDRIRLSGGTKKVKKVLLESRIPPSERHRVPLIVDAEGQVLWIPGLARAGWIGPEDSPEGLRIGIG
jgi:tRNA(Ile)-lysidine synthase